ncbi:hypothetical protein BG015_004259 [Linnemannia schmuckeri]|uniref:Uncharacterized protein n=1 Tax=Linnemannia schmuckeri TaxID=64567 RepID=A0A9P5RD99_9FUNG|nr:hypothetical protein BG015_004259 [Linnemannia schmuckeri]
MVTKSFNDTYKDAAVIAEVVLLAPVLERKDYRSVLTSIIARLERESLLGLVLHQRLVQLLHDDWPGHLINDNFVKILRVLQQPLKHTYKALGGAEHAATEHI